MDHLKWLKWQEGKVTSNQKGDFMAWCCVCAACPGVWHDGMMSLWSKRTAEIVLELFATQIQCSVGSRALSGACTGSNTDPVKGTHSCILSWREAVISLQHKTILFSSPAEKAFLVLVVEMGYVSFYFTVPLDTTIDRKKRWKFIAGPLQKWTDGGKLSYGNWYQIITTNTFRKGWYAWGKWTRLPSQWKFIVCIMSWTLWPS